MRCVLALTAFLMAFLFQGCAMHQPIQHEPSTHNVELKSCDKSGCFMHCHLEDPCIAKNVLKQKYRIHAVEEGGKNPSYLACKNLGGFVSNFHQSGNDYSMCHFEDGSMITSNSTWVWSD